MHPKNISIKDYQYELPAERIAKFPLEERDNSRLLVFKDGIITESIYRKITDHIPEGSLLLFNNTKVVEARILFEKSTGSLIEIFCLEPADVLQDITSSMTTTGNIRWKCLVGGAAKWKEELLEKKISINGRDHSLCAKKAGRIGETFLIDFSWQPSLLSFAEVLHLFGIIPIPPYLERTTDTIDKERYQTVYAKEEGSVAAPTAGLHFTEEIFNKFQKKNIQREFVTLHVGAGTFKPVKSDTMKDHEMHAEFIEVDRTLIGKLIAHEGNIICVGTTSLRTIESLYWMGVKLYEKLKTNNGSNISIDDISVQQWDAYESAQEISRKKSLRLLSEWMTSNNIEKLFCRTQIIIAPGYNMRICDALITNFHQPQSTLLLLVAALIGDDWKKVYDYAMKNDFRFLSYGDGSLLFKTQ